MEHFFLNGGKKTLQSHKNILFYAGEMEKTMKEIVKEKVSYIFITLRRRKTPLTSTLP